MKRALARAAFILTLAAASVPATAQTIKLGTLAPGGSPWHDILRDMADDWKRASGGRIRFQIYLNGVAGDESDMVRKMRIGLMHAAVMTGGGLSDIVPAIRALQLPMMLSTYGELDHVRRSLAPRLEALFEAKGFKVLNWGDAGWLKFFTRTPLIHPDELRPMRIFAWQGDSAYIEAWKSVGVQAVPMSATEIHTALQSRLITAITMPPIAALVNQWFAAAPHMLDMPWVPLVGATIITTRKWRTIPRAVRPKLMLAAERAGNRMQIEIREFDREAVKIMKRHGLIVHTAPPEVVVEWERRARKAYSKFVGRSVSPALVAEVERLRDAYRAGGKSDDR